MTRKILSSIEQIDHTPQPVADPLKEIQGEISFLSKVKENLILDIANHKKEAGELRVSGNDIRESLSILSKNVAEKERTIRVVTGEIDSLNKTAEDVSKRIEDLKKEEKEVAQSLEETKSVSRGIVINRAEVKELLDKKSSLSSEIREKETYVASLTAEVVRLKEVVDEINKLKPQIEILKKEIEGLVEMKKTLIEAEKELREKKDWIHRAVEDALKEQEYIEEKLKAGRGVLKQQEGEVVSRTEKIKNLDESIIEKEKTVSIMDAVIEFRKNKKFIEGVKGQL